MNVSAMRLLEFDSGVMKGEPCTGALLEVAAADRSV